MNHSPKSRNITRQASLMSEGDRVDLLGHHGAVLWFTGLSGSGKSTLAFALERALFREGCLCYVLDGDNIRHGLNRDLGFSPEDRTENIRRVGEVAALFADSGVIVSTAFISPYTRDRDCVRPLCQEGRFFEVYVDCPLAVCERRDPKGLYKKARAGEIRGFTAISAPYEAPCDPEIRLDTSKLTVDDCIKQILHHLRDQGIIVQRLNRPVPAFRELQEASSTGL